MYRLVYWSSFQGKKKDSPWPFLKILTTLESYCYCAHAMDLSSKASLQIDTQTLEQDYNSNVSTTAPNGLSNETPIVKNDSPSEDFDVPGWPSAGRPSDSCRHTRSPGKRPGQRSAQKAVIQELSSALNETMFKTLTLLRYSVQGISNFITLILVEQFKH